MKIDNLKTAIIVILWTLVVHLLSANYEQARIATLDQRLQDTQTLLLQFEMAAPLAQQWRSLGYQVKEAKIDTVGQK